MAGDISLTGQEIIMKTYNRVFYWRKSPYESLEATLQRIPMCAPYNIEQQGEAVCFDTEGSGYFTTSEGLNQPLWYYSRL